MHAVCAELGVELVESTAKPTTCTCWSLTRNPGNLYAVQRLPAEALSIIKQYIDGQARQL